MYLGKRPRRPEQINAGTSNYSREEMEVWKANQEYDSAVQDYFVKHVFQGPTSALGNTDTWITDFYHWQRDLHACKGATHED